MKEYEQRCSLCNIGAGDSTEKERETINLPDRTARKN